MSSHHHQAEDCHDPTCGHWVSVGGLPGHGLDVGVFSIIAGSLPKGTVVVGRAPDPDPEITFSVPPGHFLCHVPHHSARP